jgi:hypothetical protein
MKLMADRKTLVPTFPEPLIPGIIEGKKKLQPEDKF